jgi:NADH-ubiquinone oxidoreductase chain 5
LSGEFNESSLNCLNDERWGISKRMAGLMVIAVIGGSILRWLIFSSYQIICLPLIFKNLTIIVCLIGGIFGYFLRKVNSYFKNKSLNLYFFSYLNSSIWFMPLVSTIGIIFYPLVLGSSTFKSFDQGWSEFIGGQKIYFFLKYSSIINQFIQNNNLKIYLIIFVFWVIFLVIIILN